VVAGNHIIAGNESEVVGYGLQRIRVERYITLKYSTSSKLLRGSWTDLGIANLRSQKKV
jgi:hypothetical protein